MGDLESAPERMWREQISPSEMYPDGGAFYHEAKPDRTEVVEYVRADLARDPATAPAPRLKQLGWCDYGDAQYPNSLGSVVEQCGSHYRISRVNGEWYCEGGFLTGSRYTTLEAAKAAAQADYERRILSALVPAQGVES